VAGGRRYASTSSTRAELRAARQWVLRLGRLQLQRQRRAPSRIELPGEKVARVFRRIGQVELGAERAKALRLHTHIV
jgi:hypothetical protein